MVLLEAVERLLEAARHLRDVLQLLRRQPVDVLVQRVPGVDFVLHAVEARHQLRGKGQVGVAGGVRAAELQPLRLGARAVHGDADGGAAVAAAVGEIDRRLEARHQTLVAVGGGVAERRQGARVLEDAADVVQRHLGESGIAVAGKEGLAVLPQRLVGVHAAAVVAEEGLGHEGRRLAVAPGDVLDDVLEPAELVGALHQGVEAEVDFGLAGGGHLVVLPLHLDAHCGQHQAHLGADVALAVERRDREIAFLVADLVAAVAALLFAPAAPRRPRRSRSHRTRHSPRLSKRTESKTKNSASGPK